MQFLTLTIILTLSIAILATSPLQLEYFYSLTFDSSGQSEYSELMKSFSSRLYNSEGLYTLRDLLNLFYARSDVSSEFSVVENAGYSEYTSLRISFFSKFQTELNSIYQDMGELNYDILSVELSYISSPWIVYSKSESSGDHYSNTLGSSKSASPSNPRSSGNFASETSSFMLSESTTSIPEVSSGSMSKVGSDTLNGSSDSSSTQGEASEKTVTSVTSSSTAAAKSIKPFMFLGAVMGGFPILIL